MLLCPRLLFPVTGFRTYTIIASPVTVTAIATPNALCISGNTVLSLSGDPVTGAEYQWQSSPVGTIPGRTLQVPTTVPYTLLGANASAEFRCTITCGGTPIAASRQS